MPGDPAAKIEAWAVPVNNLRMLDHTYVISSCGYRWGCFGLDTGGSIIVPGSGDSNTAECLSYPRSGNVEYAGLIYFIDGVCHQATNRVLEPTGLTLGSTGKLVRGYNLSLARYGLYGLPAWSRRAFCYSGNSLLSVASIASDVADAGDIKKPSADLDSRGVAMTHTLKATVEELFGSFPNLMENEVTREKLTVIVQYSLDAQAALASKLKNREIDMKEFISSSAKENQHTLASIKETIGHRLFYDVFGKEGDYPESIVDWELAKEALAHPSPAD